VFVITRVIPGDVALPFGFNLFGDSSRDALEPKLHRA
jgi:hypothetical protein